MRPVTDSDARSPRRMAPSAPTTQGPASATPPAEAPAAPDTEAASGLPDGSGSEPSKPPKKKKMAPIGPEALRALRERIRSGQYPSDDIVRDGLERLIRRPD